MDMPSPGPIEETLKLDATLGDTLNSAPLLVMMFAEDGEVLQVSRNWLEITGYSEDEIPTLDAWLCVAHGPEMPAVADRISTLFGLQEIQFSGDYRIRTKDGSHRIWDFASAPVPPLPDGRRVLISMAIDVTESRQGEEKLIAEKLKAEAASASKSRFLAAASHDLRQPLQAIRIFVEALRTTGLNGEQEQMVEYLEGSANSLDHLINTLLDISKLDVGMVKPNPVPTGIRSIFWRIMKELESVAANKGLGFRVYAPPRTTVLRTDPNLLLVILRNLVGNAIKYTDRGGLLLAARVRRHHLAVQVWDTGVGIDGENLPRIYEEFFRVVLPGQGLENGLGLGLSIARRIADLLDYELECRSRPGRGTVFELRIPLVDLSGSGRLPAGIAVAAGSPSRFRGRHYILVEDDLLVAKALEFLLHRLGARVSIFTSAEDALAFPEVLEADFYLVDFLLSGEMNGGDFLNRVQELTPRKILGLVLTGATLDAELGALPARSWRILRKPLNPAELLATIGEEEQTAGREEYPA